MKIMVNRLLFLCALGVCHLQAALNVVVTTPDLASIAKEVGGNQVELTVLAKPTEDPHFVEAKPSFIVKLNRADALIHGGAELELGWLPALLDRARNSKIAPGGPGNISCSRDIQLLEIPTTLDRSRGDIHAAGNPHYVMDPANARIVASEIAEAFSKLDSKSAAVYRANAAKWQQELDRALAGWQAQLKPFAGWHVAAYHNSWPYFGKRFGLAIDIFLEPKPGVPPTPAHLADVILKMREEKVKAIIVDPYLDRRTAESVAARTSATVVDVAQFPGGVKGTEAGYIALLNHNVKALADALGKR